MLKSLMAAAGLVTALAATPVAATTSAPAVVDAVFADGYYFDDGAYGYFDVVGAFAAGQNFAYTGNLTLDVAFDFDLSDPYGTTGGYFDLREDGVAVLGGLLSSVSVGTDQLIFGLSGLSETYAPDFGTSAKLYVTFAGLGADPLAALSSDAYVAVDLMLVGTTAVVPLPAGILLLASGAAGLLTLRRRRS